MLERLEAHRFKVDQFVISITRTGRTNQSLYLRPNWTGLHELKNLKKPKRTGLRFGTVHSFTVAPPPATTLKSCSFRVGSKSVPGEVTGVETHNRGKRALFGMSSNSPPEHLRTLLRPEWIFSSSSLTDKDRASHLGSVSSTERPRCGSVSRNAPSSQGRRSNRNAVSNSTAASRPHVPGRMSSFVRGSVGGQRDLRRTDYEWRDRGKPETAGSPRIGPLRRRVRLEETRNAGNAKTVAATRVAVRRPSSDRGRQLLPPGRYRTVRARFRTDKVYQQTRWPRPRFWPHAH